MPKRIDAKRIDRSLPLPAADHRAAGFDLPCRKDVTIKAGKIGIVPVNLVTRVPEGYFLLIAVRSSTPITKGLILANGIGVVDPFYCGDEDEIVVQLLNITAQDVHVKRGELLTQGMFVRAESITWREVDSMQYSRDDGNGYNTDDARCSVVCN